MQRKSERGMIASSWFLYALNEEIIRSIILRTPYETENSYLSTFFWSIKKIRTSK